MFPVAERRQERAPEDEELNAYEDMPDLGECSDDDEGLPTDADSDADNQPAEADVPSAGAEVPTNVPKQLALKPEVSDWRHSVFEGPLVR